ncbi:MAG: hypothetical protein FJ218_07190 [Ignavibacteria bacterium]|nr:hypothetical protein [Ignavibacteria bacterium]
MRQQFIGKKDENVLRSFRLFEKNLFGCVLGFVVGTFINAFVPQSWNWGNHLLAFFPLSIKIGWFVFALAFLLPPSRKKLYSLFCTAIPTTERLYIIWKSFIMKCSMTAKMRNLVFQK